MSISRSVKPISEEFIAHCKERAVTLRRMNLTEITPHSVAWLLRHSRPEKRKKVHMTSPDDRCKTIARILRATGSEDGEWHHVEVMEAYRLRNLDDEELAKLDPKPPALPAQLPENLAQLNAFSKFLAQQTQSAASRR